MPNVQAWTREYAGKVLGRWLHRTLGQSFETWREHGEAQARKWPRVGALDEALVPSKAGDGAPVVEQPSGAAQEGQDGDGSDHITVDREDVQGSARKLEYAGAGEGAGGSGGMQGGSRLPAPSICARLPWVEGQGAASGQGEGGLRQGGAAAGEAADGEVLGGVDHECGAGAEGQGAVCWDCATVVPRIIVASAGGVEVQGRQAQPGEADHGAHLAALGISYAGSRVGVLASSRPGAGRNPSLVCCVCGGGG